MFVTTERLGISPGPVSEVWYPSLAIALQRPDASVSKIIASLPWASKASHFGDLWIIWILPANRPLVNSAEIEPRTLHVYSSHSSDAYVRQRRPVDFYIF